MSAARLQFMIFLIREDRDVREVGRVVAGHLEFVVLPLYLAALGVGFDLQFLVGGLAEDGRHPRGGQDRFTRLGRLHAANLETDAKLKIGGHQGAAFGLDDGLEVLQDRLDVARRHGRAGQLECLQQSLAMKSRLHGVGIHPWIRIVGCSLPTSQPSGPSGLSVLLNTNPCTSSGSSKVSLRGVDNFTLESDFPPVEAKTAHRACCGKPVTLLSIGCQLRFNRSATQTQMTDTSDC